MQDDAVFVLIYPETSSGQAVITLTLGCILLIWAAMNTQRELILLVGKPCLVMKPLLFLDRFCFSLIKKSFLYDILSLNLEQR